MALRKLHGSPFMSNAAINRKMAQRAFEGGMSAADIAKEWPMVWKLDAAGKLGQKYDSEYGDGRMETKYTITAKSVADALKKYKGRMQNPRAVPVKRFKQVKVGETFEFDRTGVPLSSGMARGPWVKTGPKKYQHADGGGHTHTVGTVNAVVSRGKANPTKPPITRQWKPVLIRTNAAGQVQIAPQATVRVKAKAVQARNPKPVMKLWDVFWSPTGQKIASAVRASTSKLAKTKAPAQYRKYKGEMYVVEVGKANPKTGRRNPGDSGPLTPLDSILSAAGYSSRPGTATRDSSGEILRTEYRNGPGKSITVLSDRRGMGKPSYSWISNGPILPAHSGVRTKQTVATLKRTLKAHLKKMDKR
jgi:hypothetical protein